MIIYLIFGYWATGKTIYANKIIVYQQGQLFLQKLIMGGLLGWILIPWAILKMIFSR
jgi:hypothetical protein